MDINEILRKCELLEKTSKEIRNLENQLELLRNMRADLIIELHYNGNQAWVDISDFVGVSPARVQILADNRKRAISKKSRGL